MNMMDLAEDYLVRRILTTNLVERINKELKRRSRPIGAFPSDKSLMRFAGCIMININEE